MKQWGAHLKQGGKGENIWILIALKIGKKEKKTEY
jgi:hypothetical protein